MEDRGDYKMIAYDALNVDYRRIDPDERTLRASFNDEAVWVKYAAQKSHFTFRAVFNVLAAATGEPVFRPTHNPDPLGSLAVEADRLRYMGERGFFVPKLLKQERDHLVVSDVGTNVNSAMASNDNLAARRAIMEKVVDHLAEVHVRGEFHGRPVIKDLTIKNGVIGMIDLEQEPLKVMPLRDAQSRDIFLALITAGKHAKSDVGMFPQLLTRYEQKAPAETVERLHHNLRLADLFARPMLHSLRISSPDNDIRHALEVNHAMAQSLRSARFCPAA